MHDIAVTSSSETEQPIAGTFNASGTRFLVKCYEAPNAQFTASGGLVVPGTPADERGHRYATLKVQYDVPGRGSVALDDVLYSNPGAWFGSGISKAGFRPSDTSFVRFPKTFNVSRAGITSADGEDSTPGGVRYDRHRARSGIDDDLGNTIFFYRLNFVTRDYSNPDKSNSVPLVRYYRG